MRIRYTFMDGSSEIDDIIGGQTVAWVYGKILARLKGTYLLNIEGMAS